MITNNTSSDYKRNLTTAIFIAALFGMVTIFLIFAYGISGNQHIHQIATRLSGDGNELYLVTSNALIILWAWRKQLTSVIKMTLGLNLFLWISVQLIKLIPFGDWALRPGALPGGFPSGHTTHAFAMAVLLTTYFPRSWWLWYPLAAAISWSRIETVAHTGLQVTAGVFYGILLAWVFIDKWIRRQELECTDGGQQRPQEIQA